MQPEGRELQARSILGWEIMRKTGYRMNIYSQELGRNIAPNSIVAADLREQERDKNNARDYQWVQGSLLKDITTLSPGFTEVDKCGRERY